MKRAQKKEIDKIAEEEKNLEFYAVVKPNSVVEPMASKGNEKVKENNGMADNLDVGLVIYLVDSLVRISL